MTTTEHASFTREFALQQYNKALGLLTASTGDSSLNAEIAAIACVLVTYFESLAGHINTAVTHCQQGRQLLALLDRLASERGRSGLVDPNDIRPIIGSLELQALCVSSVTTADSNPLSELRNLVLPDVDRLFNLDHAAATLSFSKVALMCLLEPLSPTMSLGYLRKFVAERNTKFSPWLENWYRAFRELYQDRGNILSARDIQRSHILEVNYLSTFALSTLDITRANSGWESFVADFEKIIRLSKEVLERFAKTVPSSAFAGSSFPFLVPSLWVLQPLYVTMARCPVLTTQRHAAQLLLAQLQSGDDASLESPLDFSDDDSASEDTANWTEGQWMTYAKATPLDVGSAVFFGRLRKPDCVGTWLH